MLQMFELVLLRPLLYALRFEFSLLVYKLSFLLISPISTIIQNDFRMNNFYWITKLANGVNER